MSGTPPWLPIGGMPEEYKDGRDVLLHVDWEPLTFVGYFGPNDQTDPKFDDHGPTWRVKWDGSRIDGGFDEPTHYLPIPDNVKRKS